MFNKTYLKTLFSTSPKIHQILKKAPTPSAARDSLLDHLNDISKFLDQNHSQFRPLDWDLRNRCLKAFRQILSVRSEELAQFSIVELLCKLAQEKFDDLPQDLNDGFFEELIHLLKGIEGKSDVYDFENIPKFLQMHGRDASIERSRELDEWATVGMKAIQRYAHGLDKNVIHVRQQNKKRIMNILGATRDDWDDYLWHIRHVIRNADQLEKLVQLTPEEKQAIEKANTGGLPFGITPYYASLMDEEPGREKDHAVRAQVIPPMNYVNYILEHRGDPSMSFDFMQEHDTSPIDLITRRYPRICILKPYNTCSQICVYCQRNWEIDDILDTHAVSTKESIKKAIDWIAGHETINEVLITGGDPLIMNDNRIDWLLSQIAAIKHIERIRIGTRTPVVLPQRITDELADIIATYYEPGRLEIVIVTHYEHPYEITPESMQAVQKFKRRAISLYNQAVYTVENSRRYELVALRRLLRLIGVDPYYTFNTKGKKETKNYRVPLARLMQEIKEEARLMPGMVRTDEAVYNVPRLGKNYIRARQHHQLLSILPDGSRVYEFQPWEKNISLTDTFIDTDVPIYDYLQELERRDEDPQDYKSIWYYY